MFAKLLTYKNPVATLATLILLSYAQLLRTIISSFSFAILNYPDGTRRAFWLPDANIYYFSSKHILLLLGAMVIVVVGVIYTLLLFSWQWILKLNDRSRLCMKWIRNPKFNAFMDAYHAPYHFKYRYWTGLLLLIRVALYLVASVLQNFFADARINLIFTTVIVSGIFVFRGYFKISVLYKNSLVDILELTSYFNIIMFTVATLYIRGSGFKGNQNMVANISIGITFAIFVLIVVYHIYSYSLVKLNAWKRVVTMWNPQPFNRLLHRPLNACTGDIDLEEHLIEVQESKPTVTVSVIE